jgi:hypothetical protein
MFPIPLFHGILNSGFRIGKIRLVPVHYFQIFVNSCNTPFQIRFFRQLAFFQLGHIEARRTLRPLATAPKAGRVIHTRIISQSFCSTGAIGPGLIRCTFDSFTTKPYE